MSWWLWLVLALVVVIVAVGVLLAVQARRRRGGVIVDPTHSPRTGDGGAGA